ncbi:MAG: hypothetical protein EZS28_013997 [Streblomastix strix]|uniref:Uncharacterized protein n=1 Tax=Streblomastix strix TaxID=222440 RepID=A0A5J4W6X5_9EUKA|nr:MAG: hypothetical protein EZS28_013997 [Streblomastix strix]
MKEQFTKLLCCAGGDGNDNDNVESICAEILIDILSNQIQLNKMLTIIEEDGLIEEVDDLNFHSDSRRKVGVLKKGFDLKQEIIGSSLIYEKDEFDDQYQSDEEAD